MDITITVNIVSVGSNEEHQYGELIALIACVLCKNRIKIMKLSKNCNSPSRWIYSNYHRHIKTHEKNNKVSKLNKFGKQVQPQLSALKDYFIPSTSTSTITSIPATTLSSSDTSSNNNSLNNSMIENTVTEELDFDYCSGHSGGDTIGRIPEISPNVLKSEKTKWQNKNYSRTERNRRAQHNSLLTDHLEQPLITNFYPIINKIEKIIIENQNLKQMLSDNLSNNSKIIENNNEKFSINEKQTTSLINLIANTALNNLNSNSGNLSNNNRYREVLKKFYLYLFFVGGLMMYQTYQ